ncbi:hypothetical protein PMAYCL1PPCAC_26777 [Pristionchus mayeri]|uniref:Mediator of RNA polymerase II transcription subunit 6 n=1 Tax=Pristionchus mayeri TaxID=1317129 RepID=A0AAN5D5V0_9BILA|nr:hypothetical protein PMAYCL1PPCAC_26777 [Pristionchus mayeri]
MNRVPAMPSVPKPNPLHTTFKNPNFPANFINESNVLDYFCNPDNIFYDMKSCNQIIRMQQIIDRPLEECLQSMAGDQYVVHFARPPLFVIMKQHRQLSQGQNNIVPLAYYYIINGTVYQAPDAFSLVQSRLLGAVAPLGQAFDLMLNFSRFNVAKGYTWEFDKKPAKEGDEEEEEEEEETAALNGQGTSSKKKTDDETAHTVARSSAFQEQRTTNIMQLLFEQFPPPEAKSGEAAGAAAAAVGGDAAEHAAAAGATAAAAAASTGIAAMLPPGDDSGRDEQPPTKRGK